MQLAGMSGFKAATVVGLVLVFVVGTALVAVKSVSAQTTTTAIQPSPIAPQKHTAAKLTCDGWRFGKLFLGGVGYKSAKFTQYLDAAGGPIAKSMITKGSMVNVEYYEGGTSTESYPFHPGDKVLITVRKMR